MLYYFLQLDVCIRTSVLAPSLFRPPFPNASQNLAQANFIGKDTIPFNSTVTFTCVDDLHLFDHDMHADNFNITTFESGNYSQYLEKIFCIKESGEEAHQCTRLDF